MADRESATGSTTGIESLHLQFGTLTTYISDMHYYTAAFKALSTMRHQVAWTGLLGNHINIISDEGVASEVGLDALIDSYHEYMLKGCILFGDARLCHALDES